MARNFRKQYALTRCSCSNGIVDLVNAKDIEYTSDDSSEEVLPVQLKEARIGFDIEDFCICWKYLNLLNVKEFQSKQQQKIDTYLLWKLG